MIFKLHSFYSKLSFIFLILILFLGTGILVFTFSASGRLFDEVEQLLNKEYAGSIALELQPIVEDGFSVEKIKGAIHYMMVLNPMVEIYLLDSDGYILAFFTSPGDKLVRDSINLKPLKQFFGPDAQFPILGDDPKSLNNKKPFSAANLKMGIDSGFVYVVLRGEDYDRSIKGISTSYYFKTGLGTVLFAILITLILGLILFFLLTKRLRILNSVVQDFKNGNYKSRINIKGTDELSFLGLAFNDMAQSIENNAQEKSDLITNISHDLRSPLTSIRGHLETIILKDKKLTDDERLDYLNISLKNISNFQGLVDKLFELAKLENNQIKLNPEIFSIAELTQDVIMKLQPAAEHSTIKLKLIKPDDLLVISGDIGMIERVLSNIVENALIYTPTKGIVELSLIKNYENIDIRISDTGSGIDKKDLPKIFDRFYRGTDNKTIGTGLGLAIVKKIITLHGGNITVESVKDRGTTFIISLPLK
ncbi:MAG: HAMP domain-containing histidine kinase [Spirochaetaceae bacterium]